MSVAKKNKSQINQLRFNKHISDLSFLPKVVHRKSVLFSIIVFISILKSGVWVFPAINASFIISQSPFKQPFSSEYDQYLMTYWFASWFANIIGIKTLAAFIVLHLFFGILTLFILFRFVRANVNPIYQGKSLLLLGMLPTISTIFYWIGMDTFIVFIMSCLALNYKRPYLLFSFGLIGGMHHFEIMVAGTATLLFYNMIKNRTFHIFRIKHYLRIKDILAPTIMVLGVIVGKALLVFIFIVNDVVVARDGISLGFYYFEKSAKLAIANFIPILWSMLGAIWIFYLLALFQKTKESLALFLSSLVPLALVFIVLDETRILQLTGFLLMLFGLITNENFLSRLSDKQVKTIIVLWLIIPWVWVWQKVFGSVTLFSIKYVLSRVFDNDLAPRIGSIFMWPFPF
jgi:hypothetical protein